MDRISVKNFNEGPEDKVQAAVVKMLKAKGWGVWRLIGNAFQSGLPDLMASHNNVSGHIRLIEIKLPNMVGSRFTKAQLENFPKLCAFGAGVWVLTSDSEFEYNKLFYPPNWTAYLH